MHDRLFVLHTQWSVDAERFTPLCFHRQLHLESLRVTSFGTRCRRPAVTRVAGISLSPCVPHCPSASSRAISRHSLRFGSDQHLDKVQRHFLDSHSTKSAQQTPSTLALSLIATSSITANRHVSTSDVASLDTADICMTGQS